VVTWTGTPPARDVAGISYAYRVVRREVGTNSDTLAGEIAADSSPQATLTDRGFTWNRTYEYRVAAITLISVPGEVAAQVEGEDSANTTVVAKDVFPPATPSGLQAVFSGIGQQPFIDLTWVPNTESDLTGYNVYRHEEGAQPVKVNSELAKTPAFRDSGVMAGKKYWYSVSAVDAQGNESVRSEEANEAVP